MSVMSIKEIIDLSNEIGEKNPLEVLFDEKAGLVLMRGIKKISETLESDAEKAKEIVLTKISEETFVRLARATQNAALTAMVSSGNLGLLEAHTTGELKGYTGALINDEII